MYLLVFMGPTGMERYATTQPKSALQPAELLRARVKSDKKFGHYSGRQTYAVNNVYQLKV